MTFKALALAGFFAMSVTACSSGQLATSSLPAQSTNVLPAANAVATPVLTSAALTSPATSREVPPAGIVAFSDTFEQDAVGSAPPGWSPLSGNWKICQPAGQTHEYCQVGSEPGVSKPNVSASASWTDYETDASFVHGSAGGGLGVQFRMIDAAHFYQFEVRSDVSNPANQAWDISRYDGAWHKLIGGTFSDAFGTSAPIRILTKGPSLSAYDGTTLLGSTHDSTYASGGIAFRTFGSSSSTFDNVRVTLAGNASPTPAPTSSATVSPKPGVHQDIVQGCQLYPPGDFWNLDISQAAVDPNSAAMMKTAENGSKNSSMSGIYQSQYLNVVPYNEAAGTVHQDVSYHTFPTFTGSPSDGWPIGSGNPKLAIEAGDAYANILQTSGAGHPCWMWSIYDASYSGTQLSGYGGAGFPLNVPVTPLPPGCAPNAGCAGGGVGSTGVMQRPFFLRVDEVIAGQMTHALDGEFPVASICNSEHLYPAGGSAQGNQSTNCLPGAAKIRLKASFDTSALSGDGLVVANGLKHYGIAVMDNGCCFGVYAGKQQSWDSRNINTASVNQAFTLIHMSDFEVVKLGPTNGSQYPYPGSAP